MTEAGQDIILLNHALSTVREAAFLIDERARFRYVNDEACRVLGYARAELLGLGVSDVDPDFPMDRWLRHWSELETRRSLIFEGRHRTKDGRIFPVEINANYFEYDGQGHNFALVRDITEQKNAQEALRRSEAELKQAQRLGKVGSWQLDLRSRTVGLSEEARRLFALPPTAEVISFDSLAPLIHPEAWARLLEAVEEAQGAGQPSKVEYEIGTADGGNTWQSTRAEAVRDEGGHVIAVRGVTMDVTERRRAEEEIRKLNRELERQVLQYRMLLEQASDAVFVSDADRHYVDVNIAACNLLGYSREELLHLSVRDVVPPGENPGQEERFVRMTANETLLSNRVLRRKDGSLLTAELNARQLPDGRFQAIVRDITSRTRLEKEQARLAIAVEQADEAIVITDPSATIVYVNPAFERVSGYSRAELLGANPRILHGEGQDRALYQAMWPTLLAGQTWHGTLVNRRKDGSRYEEDAVITPIYDATGALVSYVGVKRDVTRERTLEAQLRQAQKMEAVGQLAGGIAHDFNNLLTAVRGYAELARDSLRPDEPARADIDHVVLAADRAAELTGQLLAFSRRQVLQPQVLDAAAAALRLAPMLRRLLGEHIELDTTGALSHGRVKVDPGQLEQVVVNLAVNAGGAMPGGGRLTIESADVELGADDVSSHTELTPGPYVMLTVSDTGSGMDEETRARAFEPFFTTKELGKGTGMGLATVYGIVKQSQGFIYLYSELGKGTTFRIYFPRVGEPAATSTRPAAPAPMPSGTETILLAEDDPTVRAFALRVLAAQGYAVLDAASGAAALALNAAHATTIDILVTDLVMPAMNGRELAERLARLRPGMRVLYVSGFPEDHLEDSDLFGPHVAFLPKPYSADALAHAVREVLDAPP